MKALTTELKSRSVQSKLVGQIRAQDAEDLAIDVVDRRGEEQQSADHPAVMALYCPRAPGDRGVPAFFHSKNPVCRCWLFRLALGAFLKVRMSRVGGASTVLPPNNSPTVRI